MKRLFVYRGKGKCAGVTAYVLGVTEAAARARLLRDDASPYFDIDGAGVPFQVTP